MELDNVFTAGTEPIHVAADPARSEVLIPTNEDWAMVVEVTKITGNVVEGVKIWDVAPAATKTKFYAKLEYFGQLGTPPATALAVGQNVIFYRVGDFNSTGNNNSQGFELRTKTATKTSFVTFVHNTPLVFVKDQGFNSTKEYQQGIEVRLDLNGNFIDAGNPAQIKPLDPLTFFHDSKPPFALNRIYVGRKTTTTTGFFYYVFLPGFGDATKTFSQSTGNFTFTIVTDGAGHIKTFTVGASS